MEAVEAPTVKLAELLRQPEDLDKIASFKAEFTRKKAAVDSQLRIGLKEQLEITQSGMNSITSGQRTVNLIKEEMMKIDALCAQSQAMIRDFPQIGLVAATHRNFESVQKMKEDIETFDERLRELEYLLQEDDQDLENQPNLLAVHYGLSQLRDVRDAAMEQIKSNDAEAGLELVQNLRLRTGQTMQDYFNRLDEIIEWFDGHVGTACMNLVPLVQTGNNGMVVRLALIIEEEEKQDKKIQALQDAQREFQELASRFKSIAAGPKELRGYKEKFLKAIEMSGQGQIEEANAAFLDDPDGLEKSVKWYFNDLQAVKLGMVALMPKKWRIFRTYVNIYHKLMHDWLVERINDPDLKPTHMLAIIHWGDKYYKKMSKLGVVEGDLQPHLLDNRGIELVSEYRQLIVKAVDEWMDRMAKTDKEQFLTRSENSLDKDENDYFRTKTLGDMWRMLREQLLVASTSDRTDVAEGVIEAMIRALQSRQMMWTELVDAEQSRYASSAADLQEGMGAVQDWLVAVANDQIACIDDGDDANNELTQSYLTRFAKDASALVSPSYTPTLTSSIEDLRNGYVDLGTHCIAVFVALIFIVDFRTVLPEFFTPAWYKERRMGQIVSTFDDYMKDYGGVLHFSFRDILAEELSDALLTRYLGAIRNKGVKIRRLDVASFIEKFRDDVLTVFEFFKQFSPDLFEDIKSKWRVVDYFSRLLSEEKQVIPTIFEEFKTAYWDLGMPWVEAVLRARDDFDRSMLNAVKAKAAEMYIERGMETIMNKVK